jgi:hypothetical protein
MTEREDLIKCLNNLEVLASNQALIPRLVQNRNYENLQKKINIEKAKILELYDKRDSK